MGQSQDEPLTTEVLYRNINKKLTLKDLKFYYIIGKGGFGNVYKVKEKVTGHYCALKQMSKAKIIQAKLETNILRERHYLAKINSPYIVNLLCAFQDKNNLFLLMELLTGGDLRYHILNYNFYFTETQLKFLMTNLIIGLEYIHKKGIVHRDMKPENIIFDSQGFAKIADFGISCMEKELDPDDDSGTPAYMAPETLNGKKQNFSVDFYSLGVIAYELITGKVPYDGYDRKEIKSLMKNDDIDLTTDEKLKDNYSEFCLEFITLLLKKNPKERLGYKDIEEIKSHGFFMGMKWDYIKKRRYKSHNYDIVKYSKIKNGYVKELFDFDNCRKSDDIDMSKLKDYIEIIQDDNYSMYFQYYTCMCVDNIMRELGKDEKDEFLESYYRKKRMKKSQSTDNIENDDKSRHKYHHHHHHHRYHQYPSKYHGNIYKLPNISNDPAEIYHKNRENRIKNYYENKLDKYKDYLYHLKKDYKEKSHLMNLYQKNQLPMLYPNYGYFPKIKNPYNQNNSFYPYPYTKSKKQDDYYPFPPISQTRKDSIFKLNANRIMSKFFDKMSQDRNNFFVKYNKNNVFEKGEDDDDYSDYYSSDDDDENVVKYKYVNMPYNNPYYPNVKYNNIINPYWYMQNLREKQRLKDKEIKRFHRRYDTNRRTKLGVIKVEETATEESEEDEESESTKSNGMKMYEVRDRKKKRRTEISSSKESQEEDEE